MPLRLMFISTLDKKIKPGGLRTFGFFVFWKYHKYNLKQGDYKMPTYGAMSRTEWMKPNSKTGEPRLRILLDTIMNGEPVTGVTGQDIFLKNTPSNLQEVKDFSEVKAKNMILEQTNGQYIESNKIGKSPLFGGAGAGGGATGATANAESLQCLYISAMLKEGTDKPFSHFTPALLKKYLRGTDTGDINYESYIQAADPWWYSGYVTAKYLIEKGYVNQKHILHRGSRTMNTIYAAKTIALKAEGKPSMQNDKWNPGDIWAVERGLNVSNVLDASSLQNLNYTILENFKARKIVGISLKQISSLNAKAKGTDINLVAEKAPSHTFEKVLLATDSRREDFWSSKNGMIYFSNEYKADIRASSAFSTVGMEAQGKGARAGRVSYGQIQYSSKNHLNHVLKENSYYTMKAREMEKNLEGREVQAFWKKVSAVDPKLDLDKWIDGLKNSSADKIHAMLVVTDIAYGLTKARKAQRDAFITEVMNIAMAKDASSSAYVKVEKA